MNQGRDKGNTHKHTHERKTQNTKQTYKRVGGQRPTLYKGQKNHTELFPAGFYFVGASDFSAEVVMD